MTGPLPTLSPCSGTHYLDVCFDGVAHPFTKIAPGRPDVAARLAKIRGVNLQATD